MSFSLAEIEQMSAERRHRILEVLRDQLEPGARECMFEEIGPISMAISMKRIADVVGGTEGRYGLADSIREAIETAIFNATRR